MNQTRLNQTDESIQLNTLAKNSIIALVLKFLGLILVYLLQICLARWMGKTEYGAYEYTITWSLFLAVPASLGLPRAIIRFISEYRVRQEWKLLRGIVWGSWKITIFTSCFFCAIATGILFWLDRDRVLTAFPLAIAGLWLIPLQGLVLLHEDMGRGAENLIFAYVPTKVIYPLLAIAGGFWLFHQHQSLSSQTMICVAGISLLSAILIQAGLLWRKFDREIPATEASYRLPEWLKVSIPLLLFQSLRSLQTQTDILMLGTLVGPEAVGLYSPTAKTALWASFVLEAVNLVVAPAFAILHARGDRQGLQNLIARVTQWIFWSSTFISMILWLFSQPILSLFGSEFKSVDLELKILVVGQLINAFSGSVGNLLSVTGYQNQLMIASGMIALANLGLNAIFIPFWGTVGAAMTTSITLTIWNIWLVIIVMRNLQINPTVMSTFLRTDV